MQLELLLLILLPPPPEQIAPGSQQVEFEEHLGPSVERQLPERYWVRSGRHRLNTGSQAAPRTQSEVLWQFVPKRQMGKLVGVGVGRKDGVVGTAEGHREGPMLGLSDGKRDGRIEGVNDGVKDGVEVGLEEGDRLGIELGEAEGEQDGE